MTAMLDFKDVELYYDHVYALKGVSLSVSQGETVALIGANGAGKSSILRTITGLANPKSGSVTFEGERVDGTDPSSIVRRGIAMVPEGRRVFPFMSVKDNLMMGAFTRERQSGHSEHFGKHSDTLPSPERALQSGCRNTFGWRATDDGDWPCIDGKTQALAAG